MRGTTAISRRCRRTNPRKATGAHISIIGHITRDELRRQLDSTELANGFANRFLWVCAKRSRLLPDGGNLDLDTLSDITDHLHQVVDCAHTVAASGGVKLARDDDARALWHSVYGDLSTGGLGLADAVTGRAEAQVLRLSCIYALADLSFVVCRQDLEAALAVWRYCEASARYVFGQAIGDPLADAIEAELHKAGDVGLTLTEINNEVGKRNILAYKITAALNLLQEHGRAYSEMDRTTGRGRKAERWFATKETKETKDTKDLSISEFDEQPTVASTGSALHG